MRKGAGFVGASLCVSAAIILGACSSDGGDTPPGSDGGGGGDASTTTDAPVANDTGATDSSTTTDAPIDAPTDSPAGCSGKLVKGAVASFFTPQGQPALPITIDWNGCPQTANAVAASPFPTWQLDVGPGEGYLRAKAAGYYTTNTQNVTGTIAALVPSSLIYLIKTLPAFDPAKGHVVVSLNAVKSTCVGATKAGSTVTAPGHPEAVITYLDNSGADTGGASMTTDARALISNLDPTVSATVKPAIAVSGGPCTMKTLFFTDTAAVVANTVTTFQVEAE